jgi:hypothetical protein
MSSTDNIEEMEASQAGQEPSQAAASSENQSNKTDKRRGRKPAEFPCLCCGENCTKSQSAVKCIMCSLWAHKDCLKMPDSTFKSLEEQIKDTGTAYWVCRPCQSFGQRVKHQFSEVSKRQDETDKRVDITERKLSATDRRVEELERKLEIMSEKMAKESDDKEDNLCDEMQEREIRRMNLILHGVDEVSDEIRGNRERIEKDKSRCMLIFKAMKARTKREDIRFCRRIGEKGRDPRPIVVGLENEEEKRHILGRARDLKGTAYQDISIVPDLTRRQRRREAKMKEEADEKNKELTADDIRRNVKWMVVGRRGEKRLIKGVERDQQFNRDDRRPTAPVPIVQSKPAPRGGRGGARGGASGARGGAGGLSGPLLLPRVEKPQEGRWYRKDNSSSDIRDERDLGAIRKTTNRWEENNSARATDRQDMERGRQVLTVDIDEDRHQARDRLGSKRWRGSSEDSEEENPPRTRAKN